MDYKDKISGKRGTDDIEVPSDFNVTDTRRPLSIQRQMIMFIVVIKITNFQKKNIKYKMNHA